MSITPLVEMSANFSLVSNIISPLRTILINGVQHAARQEGKEVRGRGLDHNMTSPVHSNTRVTEIGKSIHHTKSKLRLFKKGGGGGGGDKLIPQYAQMYHYLDHHT